MPVLIVAVMIVAAIVASNPRWERRCWHNERHDVVICTNDPSFSLGDGWTREAKR